MNELDIRPAIASDWPQLREAVVELQESERQLHSTRLPGEQIADAYLAWMQQQTAKNGAVLVAVIGGVFVGFVAGWVKREDNIAETSDSNFFGYISDICVVPAHRGQGVAGQLLNSMEHHLASAGVRRIRICSLAVNRSARASYERAGYVPYEVTYEKIIGN